MTVLILFFDLHVDVCLSRIRNPRKTNPSPRKTNPCKELCTPSLVPHVDETMAGRQDALNQPCSDADLVEISRLLPRWREIAPVLGLTEADEVDIEVHYPESPQAQRTAMLRTWSKKNGENATYNKLVEAFKICERQDVIDKIELLAKERDRSFLCELLSLLLMLLILIIFLSLVAASNISMPELQHYHSPPSLQQYAQYLKDIYSRRASISDKKLSLLKVKAKSFINIVLVHKESVSVADGDNDEMLMDRLHGHIDDIEKKKTTLELSDVCKCEDGSLASNVLVEGAPGVGKTTFASELCRQWANGKLLQEWNVVIMIKLRDQRTRAAKTLYDLLYHPDPEIRQEITKELICQNGKGTLLLLDGYDELSDGQKHFDSVVQQIMSRELLSEATLMVTSRPLATQKLLSEFQQSIDQHIEVLGFTKKNIEEFINSACGDKPELLSDFKEYLSYHPFSSSLMYNPLQCAIVTNIYYDYWKHGEKECAPKTLTELYTRLVHTLLLRYLNDHHGDKKWRIRVLTDLPDDVKQNLDAVTTLAADGIKRRQYVFDEADDNVPSDTLGLMQREEEATVGTGTSTSHYFLHLTLQEYFAAVHYSDQLHLFQELLLNEDGPLSLKSFLKHYGEERTSFSSAFHWPVALFIAGRTKLSSIPTDILQKGLTHNTQKHVTYVNVSLLHLLYETQCPELIQSTLVTNEQYLSVSGNSALDWFVIGYCIAASASRWQVRKQSRKLITQDHMDQLAMGLNLGGSKTSCKKGNIASLQIIDESWAEISNILEWLQNHTRSVTELRLVGQLKKESTEQILSKCTNRAACIDYPVLQTLNIVSAKPNFSPFIWNIIESQVQNNLQTLLLTRCHFNIEATDSLLYILQSTNCRVQNLTLSKCTVIIPFNTRKKRKNHTSYKLEFQLKTTDKVSLDVTSSSAAISYFLLRPLFCADTLNEMTIELDPPSSVILNVVTSQYPMLESLLINTNPKNKRTSDECYLSSSVFSFSSQQNSLHKLFLYRCKFDSEATSLLIHSLKSSHCRLSELTLDFCEYSTFDDGVLYSLPSFELKQNETFSLNVSGSSECVSHLLSQYHFYTTDLAEMTVRFYENESLPLEISISQYPILEKLEIVANTPNYRSPPWPSVLNFDLKQNNLQSLSLTRCRFDSETTSSLSNFLQSQHCRLHHLMIDHCILSDDTASYKLTRLTFDYDRKYLFLIGSRYALSQMLSQTYFYASKVTEMSIQPESSMSSDPLQIATTQYSMLEKLSVHKEWLTCAAQVVIICPASFSLIAQQNTLHTLSLEHCKFTTAAIESLLLSLQSPHCKLHTLNLRQCFTLCCHCSKFQELTLELYSTANDIMCLRIQGFSCIVSQFLPFFHFTRRIIGSMYIDILGNPNWSTNEELLSVRNAEFTILKLELSKYAVLEDFRIACHSNNYWYKMPFSSNVSPIPDFSSLKNISFLSLKAITLTNEAISSLIQVLKLPHCRLDRLAVERCKISVTDHTHLITAITSCTSIRRLSIDLITDTPLIIELAKGIKQNSTLETLGLFDERRLSDNIDDFTDDQFQILIESVNSSAIETLWLRDYNKERLGAYPLSRKNVKIKWYDNLNGAKPGYYPFWVVDD